MLLYCVYVAYHHHNHHRYHHHHHDMILIFAVPAADCTRSDVRCASHRDSPFRWRLAFRSRRLAKCSLPALWAERARHGCSRSCTATRRLHYVMSSYFGRTFSVSVIAESGLDGFSILGLVWGHWIGALISIRFVIVLHTLLECS